VVPPTGSTSRTRALFTAPGPSGPVPRQIFALSSQGANCELATFGPFLSMFRPTFPVRSPPKPSELRGPDSLCSALRSWRPRHPVLSISHPDGPQKKFRCVLMATLCNKVNRWVTQVLHAPSFWRLSTLKRFRGEVLWPVSHFPHIPWLLSTEKSESRHGAQGYFPWLLLLWAQGSSSLVTLAFIDEDR
jgi:hypothetical protein